MDETLNDEITLKDLFLRAKSWVRYLRTKWLIILFVGMVGGVLGYFNAYFQKPVYTATLTFALEDDKGGGGLGGALGLASQFGFDVGGSAGGAFSGANLIELMKSRSLMENTLLDTVSYKNTRVSLAEMYIDINEWRQKWVGKPLLEKIRFEPNADKNKFTREQDSILGHMCYTLLKDNVNVGQRDKKISIISIDIIGEHELFCKVFAEQLAKTVSEFYIETKSKKSKTNVAILEKQADSVRSELNAAISGVAVSNDNTFNLNPIFNNVKRIPSARKQVDVQANMAILTELVKNLELAKMTLLKETPLIQIIDTPKLPLVKQKAGKLKSLILGGILGVALISLLLLVRRGWRNGFA